MSAAPIALLLAALASGALLLLGIADLVGRERRSLAGRLAHVAGKSRLAVPTPADSELRRDRRDSSIPGLDRLIKRFLPHPAELRQRLARTGRRIRLGEYVLGCLLITGIAYSLLALAAKLPWAVAIPLAISTGLALPHKIVGLMIASRARTFMMVFPEAIELIVRGLKSGIPVVEAMKSVGQDMPDPVGIEFRRMIDAFNFGVPLYQALTDTADRLDLADFRFFAISLSVQQQTGGNLAETLMNLVEILRRRRQMKLKIRAMSAEARTTALIVGSLPFLVFAALALIAPDYVGVLIHDSRGHVVLAAATVSLLSGAGIMRKMARFEI